MSGEAVPLRCVSFTKVSRKSMVTALNVRNKAKGE